MASEALFELQPQAYLNVDARAGYGDNGKISYTIDQAANQLLRGEPGWSWGLGQPFTVTYAYRSTAPLSMPSDTAGFERFSQTQINATELALKAWSDVANIRFVRVGVGTFGEAAYSDNAAILLGDYTSGEEGASAFAFVPGSTAAAAPDGDVWVNSSLGYNASPILGGYGATVLVHELGHAIGLDHPSDYNASADVTLTYAANAGYYEDDIQYTVMSYFLENNTGADFGPAYPAAPMLDDIAAAQLAYGANMATRLGDTVYGFHANVNEPWFVASSSATRLVFAVWDAGGTDTFDFSGYGYGQVIDLRAGYFSNVGGLVGNVAVAQNVVIENAIGGSGADVIHGNAAGNALYGGAGADSIDGGAGADFIDGSGGRNQLFGGDGADSITGGADFDAVNGNKGEDTIDGGSGGNDWLLGGQGDDLVTAHSGNAILNGNIGLDTVTGGSGDDIVRGGQGSDLLNGGGGNDNLYGDLAGDSLVGGTGADTFHIALNGGADRVLDFHRGEGDRISLDGIPSYTLTQSGADAMISVGTAGDQVILVGVQATSLGAGSILLA